MGTGLKNFTQVITAAKTIDYKKILYSNPTSNQYSLFRHSKFCSDLRRLLRTFNCTLITDNSAQVILRRSSQILVLTPLTRTREVYRFLSSTTTRESVSRLTQLASRVNYPPDLIFCSCGAYGSTKHMQSLRETIFTNFSWTVTLTKPLNSNMNGVTLFSAVSVTLPKKLSIIYSLNVLTFLTWNLNFFPTIGHPRLILQHSNNIYPFKRLIALLVCSWSNDSHKFPKYFINCVKPRNPLLVYKLTYEKPQNYALILTKFMKFKWTIFQIIELWSFDLYYFDL